MILFKKDKKNSVSLCTRLAAVCKLLVSPKMLFILPFIFANGMFPLFPAHSVGYIAIFTPAQVSRQIRDTSIVGLCTAVYSVIEVIFSYVNGFVNDHLGNFWVVLYGTIAQVLFICSFSYCYRLWLWSSLFLRIMRTRTCTSSLLLMPFTVSVIPSIRTKYFFLFFFLINRLLF